MSKCYTVINPIWLTMVHLRDGVRKEWFLCLEVLEYSAVEPTRVVVVVSRLRWVCSDVS